MGIKQLTAVPRTALSGGALGALVGGSLAAVQNTYQVAKGEIKSRDAVSNIVKESLGSGVATAAGATVISGLGIGGWIGVAGFMFVSSAAKGLWDSRVCGPLPKKLT